MKKIFFLNCLLWSLVFLSGCYNRFTRNFDQFPDINNLPSGVVDHAGLTDEDKRRQLEFLKKLDEQKEINNEKMKKVQRFREKNN